jgi:hypothetical protein
VFARVPDVARRDVHADHAPAGHDAFGEQGRHRPRAAAGVEHRVAFAQAETGDHLAHLARREALE